MKLKNYIVKAEEMTSRKDLAKNIGVHPQQLTDAKAGKAGLPITACYLLAHIVDEDITTIIALSELITEKNENRRKILYPYAGHTRSIVIAIMSIIASVIFFVTPTPSQAAPVCKPLNEQCILCKIKKQANSQIKNIRQTYLIEQH